MLCSLLSSSAWAAEPEAQRPEVKAAEARVWEALLTPLSAAEASRSRFSRARMPAVERRVRVTSPEPLVDATGRAFLPFAIDVRFRAGWKEGDLTGCAYVASGELFVKRGEAHRPASILLGKNVKPVEGVCVAADTLAVAAP